MFCSFCGKEIRDGAQFCSQCGKNQITGKMKTCVSTKANIPINKKTIITIVSVVLAIALIIVGINAFGSKSIVGVWMDGTNQIIFDKDGNFKMDSTYGTYTIDSDKTLILRAGEYSYKSGVWEFEYSKEAIDEDYSWWEDGYWYIKGNTLYLHGREYVKK